MRWLRRLARYLTEERMSLMDLTWTALILEALFVQKDLVRAFIILLLGAVIAVTAKSIAGDYDNRT